MTANDEVLFFWHLLYLSHLCVTVTNIEFNSHNDYVQWLNCGAVELVLTLGMP